jgi:RNA polymerase-binding transcription factor DksA
MSDAIFTPEPALFGEELAKRKNRLMCCVQSQRVVDARMLPLVGCTAERDVDRRRLDSQRKLLVEIDSALQRIREGGFGFCTRCGRAIPASRLDAAPATRFCRTCASSGLPRQRSFGGPPMDVGCEVVI